MANEHKNQSDEQEFREIIEEFAEAEGVDADELEIDLIEDDDEDEFESIEKGLEEIRTLSDKKPNKCVQYFINGGGYTPTTRTIQKLPAGMYTISRVERQIVFTQMPSKTDNLLRLPDSKSDLVINQIEKFWTLKDKFKEHGLVYKRGFLLWGPPGSGKSCTISIAIASMIKNGGLVVLIDNPAHFIADALKSFREVEPSRPLILIMEDIDELVKKFDEAGFLSLLDGELQIDNVVFIATTNYPERLDRRITNRPSRFDLIVKIDVPNDESRRLYLDTKLTDKSQVSEWVKLTKGMSFAHLRELIVSVLCLQNPLDKEVARLRAMIKSRLDSDEYTRENFIGLGVKKDNE